jgi:hypothetical protein
MTPKFQPPSADIRVIRGSPSFQDQAMRLLSLDRENIQRHGTVVLTRNCSRPEIICSSHSLGL